MPDTGAPYFIPYADPTDLVRDWPTLSEDVALAIVQALENIPVTEKRIETFTSSGTWTVPAGVTYAVAHVMGGGAGSHGRSSTSTGVIGADGGDSSVAFTSGTVTGPGAKADKNAGGATINSATTQTGTDAAANSGKGGGAPKRNDQDINVTQGSYYATVDAVPLTFGAEVTPAQAITITVGSGGTGGGAATKGGDGGSGYVIIEYYVEV